MARYDKVEPRGGSFRAALDVAWDASNIGVVTAVGLNANGHVVKGAGNTGIRGVLVVNEAKAAGDIVDVMTAGEIVEADGLTAGTAYFGVAASGVVNTTNTGTALGFTVEASRLVVRVAQ